MGASGSTANTNDTGDNEEQRQQESGGSSRGEAVALAAAGVAAAGVAVWGISKMLSENSDSQSLLVNSSRIFEGNGGKRSVWSPPPKGRFKINTDGGCHSVHGRPYEYPQDLPDDGVERRPSGYGGILRDHRGNWVRGFRGFIGVKDCLTAELHGIQKGLELLDNLGYHGAILESDCQAAVDWINGTNKKKIIPDSWRSIIVECRRLAHNNNTAINHVKGDDANKCAHKLADLAIDKEDEYVDIENLSQLPYEIKLLVDKDAETIGYPSN